MIRSFKLKIGLLSVVLSGVLLAGFSIFFLQMILHIGIDRIDRELHALVEPDIRKVQPASHWGRVDEMLAHMAQEETGRQFVLKVTDEAGTVLFCSELWPPEMVFPSLPPVHRRPEQTEAATRERPMRFLKSARLPAQPPLPISGPVFTTDGGWRVLAVRNPEVTLQLGVSLEPLYAEAARFRNALLLAGPVALLLLSACGWLLAWLALRPVQTISRTVEKITVRNLDQRISVARADHEFRRLIELINGMLDRLERSFQQAVRFSADAAHELKTPLTILQGELENALQAAPDGSAGQKTYKELLDEVQRLKSIIRKLLLLSQADSGQMVLSPEPLSMSRLAGDLCEDIRILAPDVEVQAAIEPDVRIHADPDLLNQLIQNLAANAVKFSRGESPILLTLKREGSHSVFRISNRGETVPDADREKIFERFYRVSRTTEGSGLGLSLAREIARAHGGDLFLESSGQGGTVFRLTLPQMTKP